ncbi:MAG: hypothetical protein F4Y45_06085 [Acidobacteria bacterium]|nr:hypothetical protein [Acidobacteriota bacterium]MYJ03414.1 hypothetical protein [Acidobacteriota bacterium]
MHDLSRARSIGELNERSLHRALKARYATVGAAAEQAIDGFVVDLVIGGRIVEIHTSGFSRLKTKLPRLLKRHRVTLVHPIPRDKYIVKVATDRDGRGTVRLRRSRRKSPKHGTVFDVFSALVSIPALLAHPDFTLEIVMTVEDELRTVAEGRAWRRRGWIRLERQLVDVVATHRIASMADLFAMVDADLPEQFTAGDLATAMKSPRRLGQQAAFCFRKAGVSEICGKRGNALVYRRA